MVKNEERSTTTMMMIMVTMACSLRVRFCLCFASCSYNCSLVGFGHFTPTTLSASDAAAGMDLVPLLDDRAPSNCKGVRSLQAMLARLVGRMAGWLFCHPVPFFL